MDKSEKNIANKSKCIPFLPVEIITNILARVPVKTVMRCRLVSKQWRDLTSTPDFLGLHFRNTIPSIMFEAYVVNKCRVFAAEKCWQRARKEAVFHEFPSVAALVPSGYAYVSDVLFSHAGLIAFPVYTGSFTSKPKFVIMNPTRPISEAVNIYIPRGSTILGVYFHPVLKEYCSLWKFNPLRFPQWFRLEDLTGLEMRYGVLNLGSNPSLRMIDYPFTNRLDKDCGENTHFKYNASPLFINNCLYWMLKTDCYGRNDIMEFNIITEEFKVILCPVPLHTKYLKFEPHLVDIDGILSFVLLRPNKITIWRLEDRAKNLWKTIEYQLSIKFGRSRDSLEDVRGIVCMGKHLAFKTEAKLFVCDLVKGRSRKWRFLGPLFVLSHKMSLASLKDCKSTISIDERGKVIHEIKHLL